MDKANSVQREANNLNDVTRNVDTDYSSNVGCLIFQSEESSLLKYV